MTTRAGTIGAMLLLLWCSGAALGQMINMPPPATAEEETDADMIYEIIELDHIGAVSLALALGGDIITLNGDVRAAGMPMGGTGYGGYGNRGYGGRGYGGGGYGNTYGGYGDRGYGGYGNRGGGWNQRGYGNYGGQRGPDGVGLPGMGGLGAW